MTTIAWDRITLAADRQTTDNGIRRTGSHKIGSLTNKNGELVLWGSSGYVAEGEEMLSWYKSGADPTAFPSHLRKEKDVSSFFVIHRDGTIFDYNNNPYPCKYEPHDFTTGSGGHIAAGVLALGQPATKAVEIASQLDPNSGMGIVRVSFENPTPEAW